MNNKLKSRAIKLYHKILWAEKNIKRLEKREYEYYETNYKDFRVIRTNYLVIRKWIDRYNRYVDRLSQIFPYKAADNSSCES